MSSRYFIEIKQELIFPVTVIAKSTQEAIEKLFLQQGEAGEPYAGDSEIVHLRRLDD